jgi:Spy/CpxP family protein refolding chaperone
MPFRQVNGGLAGVVFMVLVPVRRDNMIVRLFAALLTVALTAVPTALLAHGQESGRPHRWWHSEEIRRELALTPRQVAKVDGIFRETLPRLRASKQALDELEATLSQLISDAQVDEAEVIRKIDRVEAARGEMSKTRMLMLFRMHRVLAPE